MQRKQLSILGDWIRRKRQGDWALGTRDFTDRPAIVMGDFNINSRNYEELTSADSNYEFAANALGAYERTKFENVTEIYSDKHDTGLGFNNPTMPYPPVRGTDPVLVDEVRSLAENNKSLPVSKFGESTMAEDDISSSRYDYVWVLPPSPSDELPFYAISATPEEPYVTVDSHTGADDEPASDHAAVYAGLRFAELAEIQTYNPLRSHIVTQKVTHIQTLSYDGGYGAGVRTSLATGIVV